MHALDLGLIDFMQAYSLQKDCVREVQEGAGERILSCEHPTVITQGRSSRPEHLLVGIDQLREQGIPVLNIDRGGDVTLHTPGQLVVYPIVDLRRRGRDLKVYIRLLEQAAIDLLRDLHIDARRHPPHTGVWVNDRKIASLGIGVSKWIAYHGIALNISPDLRLFSLIRPCGLDVRMTSVCDLTGVEMDVDWIKQTFTEHLFRLFK